MAQLNERTYFLPYQRRWLKDDALLKIWEKSRRIGATYTQAYEDVRDIVTRKEYTSGRPVTRVYFSSKDEEAGKEYIEYCARYAKVFNAVAQDSGAFQVIDETGVRSRTLDFANGGRIIALSSAPTAFNSKGGKIVWDEVALHKDQRAMWSGAMPAAVVWGYPIRMLSTHKGRKTLFYQFVKDCKDGKVKWSAHRVTIVDAVNEGLLDKVRARETNERERAAYVEDIRVNCRDESIFQEDFMANPQDDATAYFGWELIVSCEVDQCLVSLQDLRNRPPEIEQYGGWDVGRKKDLSVLCVVERVAPVLWARYLFVMDKMPFSGQKKILEQAMGLPRMRRCCIDQTGMGLPLTEEAQEKYGTARIEGVTFSNVVKGEMAVDVHRLMEDRHLLIPADERLRESLHSIKRLVTAANNVRFDAERTDEIGHADHFWALALAVHACTGGSGPGWAMSQGAESMVPGMGRYGFGQGEESLAEMLNRCY